MLPPEFVARIERLVPADRLDAVLASFTAEKPPCLWLNPLRAAPAETRAELAATFPDARFEPLFASSSSSLVARGIDTHTLARSPIVTEGRAYLIGPSSLLPALVLGVRPGDDVLDLCAAPGGKTLQLAAALAGPHPTDPSDSADLARPTSGHLAAVEAVKPRFFKLRAILERHGALARPGVRLFLKDGRAVGGAVPERFDKVLLDAPCSSEARFDADDDTSWRHWSPRKVAECAHKQRALLRSALAALKVGGTLVYCTCSFSLEENEAVVRDVVGELDGAVVPITSPLPPLVTPDPIPALPGIDLPEAWRILPDGLWDGFFLVRLEKKTSLKIDTSNHQQISSRRRGRPDRRR